MTAGHSQEDKVWESKFRFGTWAVKGPKNNRPLNGTLDTAHCLSKWPARGVVFAVQRALGGCSPARGLGSYQLVFMYDPFSHLVTERRRQCGRVRWMNR